MKRLNEQALSSVHTAARNFFDTTGLPRVRPEDQPGLALEGCVPHLLAAAVHPAITGLTSMNHPGDAEEGMAGAVGTVRTRAAPRAPSQKADGQPHPKPGQHNQ